VNLASRLEGLSKVYGGVIVASESTRQLAPGFTWQEMDKVRVKGKERAVAIYQPLATESAGNAQLNEELRSWVAFLKAWRSQNWKSCEVLLQQLRQRHGDKPLYLLYASRLEGVRDQAFDPAWDGATNYETK